MTPLESTKQRPARGRLTGALTGLGAAAALGLGLLPGVSAQEPAPDERVAALKQSLAESQAGRRSYEWIETTAVSLKGEEKSRTQKRCYYGADEAVQKVPVAAPAAKTGRKRRGIRKKIVAKKKEELSDYMKRAVNLVHMYVPPDPGRIQRSKDAGKASMHVLEPGKRARLEFNDYLEDGDVLGVELDLATNRLLGLTVSSYLGSPEDPVGLDVRMGSLPDGTGYPARIVLDAKAKNLSVTVENSGYRKVAP